MKMMKNKWEVGFILAVLCIFLFTAFAAAEESLYDKAVGAYMKKDFKTAVKFLKEYVEKQPDPYAYYLLGYALYKMKNHSESTKYFEEAYVLSPNISPLSVKEELKKNK